MEILVNVAWNVVAKMKILFDGKREKRQQRRREMKWFSSEELLGCEKNGRAVLGVGPASGPSGRLLGPNPTPPTWEKIHFDSLFPFFSSVSRPLKLNYKKRDRRKCLEKKNKKKTKNNLEIYR